MNVEVVDAYQILYKNYEVLSYELITVEYG